MPDEPPAKKRGPGRPPGQKKKRVLVTVDREILATARAAGINISAAAESGIRAALGDK